MTPPRMAPQYSGLNVSQSHLWGVLRQHTGASSEEWHRQRCIRGRGDIPIECGDGVEQAQSERRTGDDCEGNILGRNPGHPVEGRQGGEQVPGNPVVEEHANGTDVEELVTRNCPSVDVLPGLWPSKRPVHSNGRQNRRPQCLDGIDAEPAEVSCETHTHELYEQRQHDLVAEIDEIKAVVDWRLLNEDHSITVGRVNGDVVSDGREHLLLESPRTWVQGVADTESCEAPVRQDELQNFCAWE